MLAENLTFYVTEVTEETLNPQNNILRFSYLGTVRPVGYSSSVFTDIHKEQS